MAINGSADWVVADGFISDDSSFYGDGDEKAELEARAASFDPATYWENHNESLSVMAYQKTAQASPSSKEEKVHNMYEKLPSGRHLSETVPEFLSRLPPHSTPISAHGPWIFVARPRYRPLLTSENIGGFKRVGNELLDAYNTKKAEVEASMAGKAKGTITRKLTPDRKKLESDIFAAAREHNVMSGKWMLFPSVDRVNEVWALIANAVVEGELGHAAKVAVDDGSGEDKARLVCAYTEDFGDKVDVKRVLDRLVGLGLVKGKAGIGRDAIYYKTDCFTYLDIMGGNEWGLKPSLYSSPDILGGSKK